MNDIEKDIKQLINNQGMLIKAIQENNEGLFKMNFLLQELIDFIKYQATK